MQPVSKSVRYPVDDERLYRCIAIALTQKKFIRASLRAVLYEAGIYADLNQELLTAAVEAWRQGLDPDTEYKAIRNLVQRRIYHFLKSYGFYRYWDPIAKKQGKGFCRRETYLETDNDRDETFATLGDNSEFIAWCKALVEQALGWEAWEEVKRWANTSPTKEPQGLAAASISILKEVFNQ